MLAGTVAAGSTVTITLEQVTQILGSQSEASAIVSNSVSQSQ